MGSDPSRATRLPERIHFLGLGGAGISGVARILGGRGHRLSGHDRAGSRLLEALELTPELEVFCTLGESRAEYLPADAELVIRSAAVPGDDPQVLAARERGLEVLKYAQVLPLLFPPKRTLAVAGTHGKTSTCWLLWHALAGMWRVAENFEHEPAALIGGLERDLGTNAVAGGADPWFVVEACEYDRTFLNLAPRGAVIANVEPDHLDYYGSFEAVVEAFEDFARRVAADGLLVLGPDVPESVEAAAHCPVWRLGRELELALVAERAGCFEFGLVGPGFETHAVALSVPGRFNVDNAATALALALGLPARQIPDLHPFEALSGACAGVELFLGAGRRFEPWGQAGGVDVVHDYAHHPTEVRVTLEAARRTFAGRPLHVLFQPHQHSRTARFLLEFAESLRLADRVVVADVYGARVHSDGERLAGAPDLVMALRRRNVEASPGGPLRTCVEAFTRELPAGAAALVLGAGDIENIQDELLDQLALRGPLRREPLG